MRAQRYAGAFLLLLAVAYLVAAFFIGQPVNRQQLGPDAFPKAVGVLMLVLSGIFLWQQFRTRPAMEDENRAAIIGADEKLSSFADFRVIGIFVALMLAYAFLFERLGYAITTFVVFMAAVLVLDRKHLARDSAIALVASFGLFLAFTYLLRVRLPAGPLSFLF